MAKIEKAKKYFATICLTLILVSQPGVTSMITVFPEEASAQLPPTRTWYADTVGIRAFYNTQAQQRGLTQISTDWNGQGMVSNDAVTAQKICEFAGYNTVISRDCYEYGSGGGRCNFTSCSNNTMGVWSTPANNMSIVNSCGYTWLASLTCGNSSPAPNPNPSAYCANGTTMTAPEMANAIAAHAVTATFSDQSGRKIIHINNITRCSAPVVLSSYKMFIAPGNPGWLDTQEFIEASPVTNINSFGNTDISVAVASCMTQIDLWYQQAPQHLVDSDPYHDPNHLPYVMFAANNSSTTLCRHVTSDCANGTTMTLEEFQAALASGRVTEALSVQSNRAYSHIVNNTNCTAPVSLSSYKMVNDFPYISTQQFIESTPLTNIAPNGTTDLSVALANCRTQYDFWYGQAPQVLVDNGPYGNPGYIPHIIDGGVTSNLPLCLPVPVPHTPACGPDTAATYTPSSQTFFLKAANTGGVADASLVFSGANSSWIPLLGDWDGNGVSTPGAYDPASSTFYLKNSNTSGPADSSFIFKPANVTFTPITGDWNGDGRDTIGVYDPSTSTFYLRDTNSAGNSTVIFGYGQPGWIPLAGDWTGKNYDSIGVYDPSTSGFYLRNTNSMGYADISFGFGIGGQGWTPIAGDWTGKGYDSIGLYEPATSSFYLRNSNTTGYSDIVFGFGIGGQGWKGLAGATCVPPAPVNADLSISKTGPATITQGTVITYSLTATNAGPATATNVTIADPIPSGLTFNAGASDPSCVVNGANVLCNNFSLTSGQSKTVAIAFTVTTGAACNSTIVNNASVSASSTDQNPGNNQSQTVSTTVNCQSDLSISKTGPATITQGTVITYSLTATNAGPATATNVTIADPIPSGLTFNAGASDPSCVVNGANVLCNNFSLTSGQSKTVAIAFTVTTGAACNSTIVNNASVSASSTDPNPGNNQSQTVSTSVNCPVPQADLSISKTGPSTITQGNVITYSLTASNAGPATATNVVIEDVIPTGLTFVPASSDSHCVQNGAEILCNNFSLNAGESRSFSVAFTVTTGAACNSTIQNHASVSASSTDPNPGNNQSQTVSTSVNCPAPQADLSITKTGPASVTQGNVITYSLTATNAGPATATNVTITDPIPSGLTFNAGSSDPSCVVNGANILCNNFSLTSGQSKTVAVAFTVTTGASCNSTIVNNASVSASSTDPNPNNNHSNTVSTTVNCPVVPQCRDGIDNDYDGFIDYPSDFSCSSPDDNDETHPKAQCQDGLDNDGDGLVDMLDPGCSSVQDNDESNTSPCTVTKIWQLGNFDYGFGEGNPNEYPASDQYTPTFDYSIVGQGSITPNMPGYSSDRRMSQIDPNRRLIDATQLLNLHFSLPQGLTSAQVIWSRYGSEQNSLILDSSTLSTTTVSEGINGVFKVPATLGTGTHTMSIRYIGGGANDGNYLDAIALVGCIEQPPQADLSITKTGPSTVTQGNVITYSLTASNAGPATATNVTIADPIPSGLTFNASASDPSCVVNGANILCNNFSLTTGQSKTVAVAFTVTTGAACNSTIQNHASVSASSTDPNPGNNQSQTVSTTVQCAAQGADLSITKTGPSVAAPNGNPTYIITVTNAGPGTATNVVIADPIPSGLTFNASASDASCHVNGTNVLCDNFSLTSGQSKTVNITFTVPSSATCNSTIQNTATVSTSSTDPVSGNNTSQTVSTTVQCPVQNADVRIQKTGPCSVNKGGSITYAITAINDGPGTATNVVVIDQIPSGLTFSPSGSDGHCIQNGPEILCNNFNLQNGETRTFGLVFTVSSSATCNSVIQNAATISTSSSDPNPYNNTSQTVNSTVLCAQQEADLSITKTGPSTIARGTTVTYTLTATNAGPGTATNVVIADPIPSGLTFNAGASDSSCIVNGPNVLCNNFNLASGASKVVTVAFSTSSNATCNSTIQNNASVSASSTDPNPANNQSQTVSTTLTCPSQGADLSVEKVASTVSPVVGGLLQYVITARNIGPDTATSVVVTDPIPSGLTFSAGNSDSACTQNGSNVVCTVASLSASQLKSFSVAFTITSGVTCNSTITNTATIASSVTDPATGNNTSQVVSAAVTCPVQSADVAIAKYGMSTVARGGIIQYTLTVTNAGPNTASGIVISDPIPTGLTFSASNSNQNCAVNGTNVMCNATTLAAGQSTSFVVAFTVPSTATCNSVIQNTASVSISSPTDPNTTNNQSQVVSSTVTCTSAGADLSIAKTGPSTVAQGGTITYAVTATNAGPETATGVIVRDTIPAGLTFTASGSDTACAQSGAIVRCTAASLTSGQSKVFALVFTVPTSVTCNSTIANNATVASNTTDPVMGNNTSQVVNSTVTCSTQTADLSITKTTTQSTVAQGGVLSYTVTATNAGPGTATNVVIADVVPANLTFNAGASDTSCRLNGTSTSVLCDNFSLNAGQSKTVTIAFTVSSSFTCNTAVSNSATVSTSATDPVSSNNTSQTVSTTVTCGTQTPTYSISKTDNRTNVTPGEALTYLITVTNTSSVNGTNVVVTDYLPANLTYISASNGGILNGSTITWTIPSITAGATQTLTAVLAVPTTMIDGTVLTNIAAVNGTVAQDTTTVGAGSGTCNLSINTSDSRDPVNTGDSYTYTIEVHNLNSTATNNVSITQTLDSSVDFLSASNSGTADSSNTVRWTGISLGANSSTTFTTTVRVRSGREGATIHSYISSCGTQDSENTQVNGGGYVDPVPPLPPPPPIPGALTLDKQADRSEAQPGSIVSYTISIRNSGSTPMGPVTLEDTFDSSQMTVQDAEGGTVSGGRIQWNIGTVGGGATRLVHYRVRLSSSLSHGQTVSNTARITGTSISDVEEVHIIKNFPQTGLLGSFFKSTDDGSQYLQPTTGQQQAQGEESASLPMVLWLTLAAMGMGTGSFLGKKFFLMGLGI